MSASVAGFTVCLITRSLPLSAKDDPPPLLSSQDVLDDALSSAAAYEADGAGYLGLLLRWGANPMARDCQALRKAVLHGRTACVTSILRTAGERARFRMLCV